MPRDLSTDTGGGYKWVALSNTTMAIFMSALDGSIVIIALPAIFRGIGLDPLDPSNIGYVLWIIMGYRLVQAVLVVTVGRCGDMFGRVRIYNAGFAVFAVASLLLSFDLFHGGNGALWLIGWRVLQAVGGSMLTANSAAILVAVTYGIQPHGGHTMGWTNPVVIASLAAIASWIRGPEALQNGGNAVRMKTNEGD